MMSPSKWVQRFVVTSTRIQAEAQIRLVAPPLYVMSTTTTDKAAAIELMDQAVAAIETTIQSEKGDLTIKMKPKVVSETEDAELKALMDQFEAANVDVAGDDDSEEE